MYFRPLLNQLEKINQIAEIRSDPYCIGRREIHSLVRRCRGLCYVSFPKKREVYSIRDIQFAVRRVVETKSHYYEVKNWKRITGSRDVLEFGDFLEIIRVQTKSQELKRAVRNLNTITKGQIEWYVKRVKSSSDDETSGFMNILACKSNIELAQYKVAKDREYRLFVFAECELNQG